MKVIILAAGLGSRLDASQDHLPKPLTKLVNGKSILGQQVDTLSHLISLDQIYLIVGYHKEAIMELFPDLVYIYNPLYAKENTSKSLARALKKMDEDVLWLNGDVLFKESVIKKVLDFNRTCMIVNQTSVGEEEVKYRTDGNQQILEVSKKVQKAEGEALGVNFYKQSDLPLLKKNLEKCLPSDYFEKAIELSIQQGQKVWALPIDITDSTEIDFPEDLKRANQMLQSWI